MLNRKAFLAALALLLSSCLFVPRLHAQTQATATGRVFDQTGAAIPGVTVELLPGKTGTARSMLTGEDGAYRFDNVAAGRVEVSFRLINFSTVRRTLTVATGETLRTDVTLVVSSTADITVTAPLTF